MSSGSHVGSDDLQIGVYDISRAHFMSMAGRELYIELPDIDQGPNSDMVGKLNRTIWMQGCK